MGVWVLLSSSAWKISCNDNMIKIGMIIVEFTYGEDVGFDEAYHDFCEEEYEEDYYEIVGESWE